MKVAYTKGNVREIYYYGSKLLRMKRYKEALDAYKLDYDKAPKEWLTNFGLAKGYAAMGDKTSAIKYADSSIQLASGKGLKEYIGRLKQDITEGKDVSRF
jgi:tetratricopeptide (TPR) repeat protein